MKSKINKLISYLKNGLVKNNKNTLKQNIWLYLIIFSFVIIVFLWIFQVVFINSFYEFSKSKQIKNTANEIINNYDNSNFSQVLDNISYNEDVCIEIVMNRNIIYSSNNFNRGCVTNTNQYISDFYNNNYDSKTYKIINSKFSNKNLIYGLRINNNVSVFVNASLEPLNNTVLILSQQLIIVSLIVLLLAFVIGYFISKKISRPIESITLKAKKLAKGNYNFNFNTNSTISEIDELSNTLNYAKKELEKTNDLRNELMANVSHDLKTPLTMIKGYAEMVRDLTYKNKEKREENLNIIIEETDRLNKLVEDILDLSSMQANTKKLNIEEFDLIEAINIIIKHYNIFKETEGYNFVLNTPKKLIVKADKKRIEQVIYNLVNNAINYTGDNNTVRINVFDNNNIRVEIIDSGKGIKKNDLPYIWDKYYHSNKKHKRNLVGTGLGLSIVKSVLENHNFNYGVLSEHGKGTTFYFEIHKD